MVEVWHQRHLKTKQVIQEYEYHILNVAVTKSTKILFKAYKRISDSYPVPQLWFSFPPFACAYGNGEASWAMDGCLGGQLFLKDGL